MWPRGRCKASALHHPARPCAHLRRPGPLAARPPAAAARRRWMKVVLQPLNEKAADIVIHHVDLLRTPYIDPLLLQVTNMQ